jgi:hypothetical protein
MSTQAPPAPTKTLAVAEPEFPAGWYDNPTGPGQRYWDGVKWTDSYAQPVKKGWGFAKLFFGYLFAVMGGLLGIIFGLTALFNSDPRTKHHGIAILAISIIATIVWITMLGSSSSA